MHRDDTTLDACPPASGNGGTCTKSHKFTATGAYLISATATDADAAVSPVVNALVMCAIYDPSAGFVGGGGWVNSPAGANANDAAAEGKASFGALYK